MEQSTGGSSDCTTLMRTDGKFLALQMTCPKWVRWQAMGGDPGVTPPNSPVPSSNQVVALSYITVCFDNACFSLSGSKEFAPFVLVDAKRSVIAKVSQGSFLATFNYRP